MNKPFIFFDIGSTLMDGPDFSPASRFMREMDLSRKDKEKINNFLFTENITTPEELTRRFKELIHPLPANADKIIKKVWDAQYSEGFEIPGAMETIKKLSERGYRLGIISNIWHPYYQCFQWLFAPVMDKFEKIILSYQVGYKKPHIKIFQKALSTIGLYEEAVENPNSAIEAAKKVKVFTKNKADPPNGAAEPGNAGFKKTSEAAGFEDVKPLPKTGINQAEATGFKDTSKAAIAGDSYHHDIAPAIKIGMKTIWVLKEHKRESPFLRDIVLGKIKMPDVVVGEIGELGFRSISY